MASTRASKRNFAQLRHDASYDGDDDLDDGMRATCYDVIHTG